MVGFLCFNFNGFGQTPSNDCTTVTASARLTVGATCSTVTWNSNNNTDYWDNAALGACPFADDLDDAWGWFQATSTSTTITYTSIQDAILTLFTGACSPTMTDLACADNTTTGAETIVYSTTIGTIYMVRIQRYNSNNNMAGNICVYNSPPPPGNDNCATATPIGVSLTTACTTSVAGTTVLATQSLPAITCGGTGTADDDVWYSFVAGSTIHTITVTPGTLYDAVIDVRSGACNGTNIACADNTINAPEVLTVGGLSSGTTYYVRVYSYGGNGNQGTFNICVTTPVDPCTSITNIASCGTAVNATIAAGNGVYSQTSCWFGGTPGAEQIYSFTPATSGNYTIQQNSSFGWIDYFYKTQAAGCSGTGWTCIGSYTGAATSGPISLTAGTTYYFMLDPESTTGGNVNFTITCPPPVPINDLCANATDLPCNGPTLSGTTVGTLNAPSGTGCTVSSYGVWYTFLGDGQQTTITSTASFDHEMNITSGSCGSQTNIVCVDNTFSPGTESYTFITTNSVRYYVYVAHWDSGSSTTGTFTISRTCTPTTPPPK
ncbi:MAG: hypothetical protein R2783_06560 [Gelidibacter sp.]